MGVQSTHVNLKTIWQYISSGTINTYILDNNETLFSSLSSLQTNLFRKDLPKRGHTYMHEKVDNPRPPPLQENTIQDDSR